MRGMLVAGKRNAIQALYQSGGIEGAISKVFVSATLLWRQATKSETEPDALKTTNQLIGQYARIDDNKPIADLLMLVEKMNLEFRRRAAKNYAVSMACEAA